MKNNYTLREEGNRIFMCCGKAGCPSVALSDEGLIEITDDFGNTVKMKTQEAELIKSAVEKLSKSTSKD
mgnify:FL=1